jgi:hypothetical protein
MQIGFIDYSHEERNKILSTLKLLGDQTALDELGIGVVRDAYADLLFPGISTLQTRAKYFVLIPYLFQSAKEQAEKGKIRSGRELLQWVNEGEDRIAAALTSNCPPNEVGIIGSNAFRNPRSVKVKPSTIYWSGLRAFGILRGEGISLSTACMLTYAVARKKATIEIHSDGESFDDPTAADQGEALFLPLSPDYDYLKDAIIDLSNKEARFLRDCIVNSPYTSGTLLKFFVQNQMICDDFLSVPVDLLTDRLRRDYLLAKEFSRFIYGAHIRYNVIYSDYSDPSVIEKFNEWRESFLSEPFDLEPVLDRVSCGTLLAGFCRAFLEAVIKNDVDAMDNLIVRREIQVKGPRAKLKKPEEYRYDPCRPVHLYQLNYRFDRASVIIRDILKGLEAEQSV